MSEDTNVNETVEETVIEEVVETSEEDIDVTVDVGEVPEEEELPSDEDKRIVEFCLECFWEGKEDRPVGRAFCPACGGRVMRQQKRFMQKARQQNKNRRGI